MLQIELLDLNSQEAASIIFSIHPKRLLKLIVQSNFVCLDLDNPKITLRKGSDGNKTIISMSSL